MIDKLYQKAFLGGRYFTIAIRKRSEDDNILTSLSFTADFVVPASFSEWCADPIVIDDQDKTYLFYEAVSNNRGRIEVAEVLEDGSLTKPTILLESEYHYSYPFVFQMDGEWYMIPESSAEGEVRLYKATAFPYCWEMKQVLLREKAVDTTVLETDEGRYLLTFVLRPESEAVTPRCYRMTFFEGTVLLTELDWDSYDPLKVRGAGPVFDCCKKHFRPYQISREKIYGDAVGFAEIIAEEGKLKEYPVAELAADNVVIPTDKWFDGLHTYSRSKRFEAIDIRCRDFDLFKLGKTLARKVKR